MAEVGSLGQVSDLQLDQLASKFGADADMIEKRSSLRLA